MSQKEIRKITCPACSHPYPFPLWVDVNTEELTDIQNHIKSRELFTCTCPECGKKALIDYGMLYHDPQKKLMICYSQEEQPIQNAFQEFRKKQEEEPEYAEYVFRVVSSQNGLREKLVIFDADLDDRYLEIIKLIILRNLEAKDPELEVTGSFFLVDSEGRYIIEYLSENKVAVTVEVKQKMYDEIKERFHADLLEAHDASFIINQAWAFEYLRFVDKRAHAMQQS